MALRLPVYISSVNNLSDARYCAGMGVKWLGFSTQDLGTSISENDLKGILQWVEGIETILEIRTHKIDIDILKLDFNAYLSEQEDLIPQDGKTRILEIDIKNSESLDQLVNKQEDIDFILLKSSIEIKNIGESLKNSLKILAEKTNLILGLGINQQNLEWIEKELKPSGIMLKGGNEIRPGFKDFDGLAEILEYLETD